MAEPQRSARPGASRYRLINSPTPTRAPIAATAIRSTISVLATLFVCHDSSEFGQRDTLVALLLHEAGETQIRKVHNGLQRDSMRDLDNGRELIDINTC